MKRVKIILLCVFTLGVSVLFGFAAAQPSPLSQEELGIVDAVLAFVLARWPEIGTVLYAAAFARALVPKNLAQKNGVRWLFWIWDRIAMNWGGAKNG